MTNSTKYRIRNDIEKEAIKIWSLFAHLYVSKFEKWNYNFQVKYSLVKLEIEFLTKLIFVKESEGHQRTNPQTEKSREKHQAQRVSQGILPSWELG